ncbi:MAG: hypothetical protein ACPGWR_00010 [Ardenticatenaceae bacterium]
MVKATINLKKIRAQNAHQALHDKGYANYYFIGDHNRERNLAGSPLCMGPTERSSYREWLWDKIQTQDSFIANALREVSLARYIVHENCVDIAVLIAKATKWYKQNVLMPQIVCTVCLTYLTDYNKGDFHMCTECAWSGKDDDPDSDDQHFKFFCEDCNDRMHDWVDKMYGQCTPCREKEQRELNAENPW